MSRITFSLNLVPMFWKMRQIFTVFRALGLVIFAVDSEQEDHPLHPIETPGGPRLVAGQQRATLPITNVNQSPSGRLGLLGPGDGRAERMVPGSPAAER